MKALHKARLLKLANHLRHLRPTIARRFDFSNWITENCETRACAIGECPRLFPKQWTKGKSEPHNLRKGVVVFYPRLKKIRPRLKDARCNTTHLSIQEFFGLNENEAKHLFVPECQRTHNYGGWNLSDGAGPKAVARQIELFIKRKEKQNVSQSQDHQ